MYSKEFILSEISIVYETESKLKTYLGSSINELTLNQLNLIFNKFCEQNSEELTVKTIYDTLFDTNFLIDSPDGWLEVGNFFLKSPQPIYTIKTANGLTNKVAANHLFETPFSWIMTKNLTTNDLVLTKAGYSKLSRITVSKEDEIYDFEVLHENHRYWSDGVSSHNSGKTFLCLNAVRELQKLGYLVFYVDTEGAIDSTDFPKFGCSLAQLRYYRMGLISDIKFFIDGVIETIKELKNDNPGLKIALFVDSLGHLDTDKARADIKKGKNAADMGLRAKELRALFKAFTLELSNLYVPFIFTNHTYDGTDQYTGKTPQGGGGPEFAASIILMLSKGKLKDEDDGKTVTGIIVRSNTRKNRLARPIGIEFHISHQKGMNAYVGLQDYVSWENCGVARGKKLTEKEYSKLKESDQEKCFRFETVTIKEPEKKGEKPEEIVEVWYFQPGPLAKNFISRHNGDVIPIKQFFTGRLFTREVLTELDERVIKPTFKYPETLDGLSELEADELEIDGVELEDEL